MARTVEQNERMRDARKESIRNAALVQFSKKGLFATRIQDIARSAGMSQGLLYHYYPSKDAIYVDLIDEALDKLMDASMFVRDMDGTAEEKIRFALKELIQTIKTNDRFVQTTRFIAQAINSTAIPDEARKLLDEKHGIPYQIMAQVMEAGQAEGSVIEGDPQALATLFWATITGLAIQFAVWENDCAIPEDPIIASMFLRRES